MQALHFSAFYCNYLSLPSCITNCPSSATIINFSPRALLSRSARRRRRHWRGRRLWTRLTGCIIADSARSAPGWHGSGSQPSLSCRITSRLKNRFKVTQGRVAVGEAFVDTYNDRKRPMGLVMGCRPCTRGCARCLCSVGTRQPQMSRHGERY